MAACSLSRLSSSLHVTSFAYPPCSTYSRSNFDCAFLNTSFLPSFARSKTVPSRLKSKISTCKVGCAARWI
jgi:hypothetical protein